MAKKRKIVIIGAGMAGLTAANKLYTCTNSTQLFDLCVVEAGSRIGGRINTSEFSGDRIEMGATWIHGIGGSPVHKIATEIQALQSTQPWECMDGFLEEQPKTFAEGGFELNPSLVESASTLYKKLMDFAQKKLIQNGLATKSDDDDDDDDEEEDAERLDFYEIAAKAYKDLSAFDKKQISVGAFVKKGLNAYWDSVEGREELKGYGKWNRKSLEEAVFSIFENTERTYTSAGDLSTLDLSAESEYIMFPGEEITIAKGYLSIIESLASVLPPGLVQLEKKVSKIDWRPNNMEKENGFVNDFKPVKLHFSDGSTMLADHVIITVSLGVLKSEISQSSSSGMFNPSLPCFKTEAISRLGFGVVNKLFLEISGGKTTHDEETCFFPSLQMAFHPSGSEFRCRDIPWWMRKTASLSPIYKNSKVLLAWFAGEEALELESLSDEEIINGVTTTISNFLPKPTKEMAMESKLENGNGFIEEDGDEKVRFTRVLKSKWGNDPLFLGSYSYVAVGSSGDDLDKMAEPLPKIETCDESLGGGGVYPLQILFAGEATHRTHYSTTHGAYFSGLREANRLLNYYHCV